MLDQFVIDMSTIAKKHIRESPSVLVLPVRLENDISPEDEGWRCLLCSVAKSLALLRAVNPREADTFRTGIVQDFYRVAIEDGDDWAEEFGEGGWSEEFVKWMFSSFSTAPVEPAPPWQITLLSFIIFTQHASWKADRHTIERQVTLCPCEKKWKSTFGRVNISYLTPPSQPLRRSRLKSVGAWSTTLRKSRSSSRQTDAEMNRLSYRGLGPPRQNKGPVPFGAEPFCFSFRDVSTVRSQCFHRACTVVPSRVLKHDSTVCHSKHHTHQEMP
jgi:hypothetical protein